MRVKIDLVPKSPGAIWEFQAGGRAFPQPLHAHDEVELNLITSGSATYLVRGRRFEASSRHLLWLFPGQNHLLLKASKNFAMWVVVIRPRFLREAVKQDPLCAPLLRKNPSGDFCRRLGYEDSAVVESLCRELHAQTGDPVLFPAGLLYTWLRAWRAYSAAAPLDHLAEMHPAVERAVHLLQEEPEATLGLLAKRAGLSASRLSRLFKAQMRMPLVQFRNLMRLKKFLRVYGSGQRVTMLTAALEAGFQSYPQFYRVFRGHFHANPRAKLV